jgi:hypothetical protein
MSRSESHGTIRVNVEVKAEAGGRIFDRDGNLLRTAAQRFERIDVTRLRDGDWLLNPATNESHVVAGFLVDEPVVLIGTKTGVVAVPIDQLCATLLVVR